MNRTRLLSILAVLLVVGSIVWHYWSSWGLITIHSDNRPLSEIIRSIEKQGHVTLKTNLDLATPVHMHVDDVVLAEALETLSTVTESRWRLTYVLAADKASIAGAIASLSADKLAAGWKSAFHPAPSLGDDTAVPPDPRRDPWNVKAPKEPTLQGYIEQAALSVSASFVFPESWNPAIKSPPKSGPIASSISSLAGAARGRTQEVFFLQKTGRYGDRDRDRDDDAGGPRFASMSDGGRGGFNRDAMQQRMQAEIEKLPVDKRSAAQKEFDERKAFFEGMRDLSPEERRAKMQEFADQPKVQERMDAAMAARDARSSPQQRLQRAHKYMDHKAQAQARSKQ